MTRSFLLAFYLTSLFTACETPDDKKPLIGHWKLVKDTVISQIYYTLPVELYHNHLWILDEQYVDTQLHHFRRIESGQHEREYLHLGTISQYAINHDSLWIMRPEDSTWVNLGGIQLFGRDSLVTSRSYNNVSIFKREEVISPEGSAFNRIALSGSGSVGKQPIVNVLIDCEGNIIFHGAEFVQQWQGFFKAKVSSARYDSIEFNFNSLNVLKLPDTIASDQLDGSSFSVTFLKNTTILKSVEDHELRTRLASNHLLYLFQHIKLTPFDSLDNPYGLPYYQFTFLNQDKLLALTQSQSFVLWNYLRQAEVTTEKFKVRYKMNLASSGWSPSPFSDDTGPYKLIESDGRYFRVTPTEHQPPITLDIGFNFLEETSITLRLLKPKAWEH